MSANPPNGARCTIRCLGQSSYCMPRYAQDMRCRVVPGGLQCLGSCRNMKSACFGRRRPIYDSAWLVVSVHSPYSLNADINLVSFNPTPPNNVPSDFVGFMVAQSTGIHEFSFTVQPQNVQVPQLRLSRQFEDGAFVTVRPIRYDDIVHWTVNGDDLCEYVGRPKYPNACSRNFSHNTPQQGDACLLARPWRIEAADDVFEKGDTVREHDRFLLTDAYAWGRTRRFLAWQPGSAGVPGAFVLTDRENCSTFSVAHSFNYMAAQQCNFTEEIGPTQFPEIVVAPPNGGKPRNYATINTATEAPSDPPGQPAAAAAAAATPSDAGPASAPPSEAAGPAAGAPDDGSAAGGGVLSPEARWRVAVLAVLLGAGVALGVASRAQKRKPAPPAPGPGLFAAAT